MNTGKILFAISFVISAVLLSSYTPDTKITNAEKLGFPKGSEVILLHCDDGGMCNEANIAIRNYFEKGDIQSAAVILKPNQ